MPVFSQLFSYPVLLPWWGWLIVESLDYRMVWVLDIRTWRLHIAKLSSLLCSDFAVQQWKNFSSADVHSEMWLQCRRACFTRVSVQLLCSTGNPMVKAHLTFSVQPPWTSPTKRHCRAQPGTAAAFCQVASRRYCCTGGCMGRSLWDPSLLQRRICENNLFFYSIEFSRETRAQSCSNTAVKEPSIILPQAHHL